MRFKKEQQPYLLPMNYVWNLLITKRMFLRTFNFQQHLCCCLAFFLWRNVKFESHSFLDSNGSKHSIALSPCVQRLAISFDWRYLNIASFFTKRTIIEIR